MIDNILSFFPTLTSLQWAGLVTIGLFLMFLYGKYLYFKLLRYSYSTLCWQYCGATQKTIGDWVKMAEFCHPIWAISHFWIFDLRFYVKDLEGYENLRQYILDASIQPSSE